MYRLCALSSLKFPLYETEAYVYQDTDIFPPAGKLARCILFYNKQKRQLCWNTAEYLSFSSWDGWKISLTVACKYNP